MESAFIFDMNGTMIDDMDYHTRAWYKVLNDLGAGLSMEQTKLHMYGKAEEMFDRVFGPDKFSEQELHEIILNKELAYQDAFRPHLKLIDGLGAFLQKARAAGIGLAIGTAAPKTNVDYVMDGLQLHSLFQEIIGAEDVRTSKPDPEVFLSAAAGLKIAPEKCIVFEDSPKGVEAAERGGMKAVVVTTFHGPEDFAHLGNVLMCVQDYTDGRLERLFA
ncbi:HAD family hydrolase [Arachidicoccus terrestris]|uniref:HAD family hydrolase n=1 Tax=Arachidicoccus terrestris TaxID=2875539 RepID=UPI001CC7E7FA|nr:HAD family phosphatase [Arachidicoccus terrestris]UAY53769.1 HAD family phosphatase [Arachidicoccus terrestris]